MRLFVVEPDDRSRVIYRAIAHDARQVGTATDLTAAVVIAATCAAQTGTPVWVSNPDRWACEITGDGSTTATSGAAPLDAIKRVLAMITIPQGDMS